MTANGALTLKSVYGGTLVPVDRVKALLAKESNVESVQDFSKAVEAARKIDSKNSERKSYWDELAIFSTRRVGELISQGQQSGTIATAGRPKKCDTMSQLSLSDIGIEQKQAERAKKIASIPEDQIHEYIAAQKEKQDDITKAGLVRFTSSKSNKSTKSTSSVGTTDWSLHDGLEAINEAVREILDRWPNEFVDTLGHKLISLGEEIRDTGGLA